MNLIFLKKKQRRRCVMKVFEGYLVYGIIRGQGTPYLFRPSCEFCRVVHNGEKYEFYVDNELVLVASTLSGQDWEVLVDDCDNRDYFGEYWDFISIPEMERIYKILREGETLDSWLEEKYAGWGI
jgi:hypothetical protein